MDETKTGLTSKAKIQNKDIRKHLFVIDFEDKMRENHLRWIGHIYQQSVGQPVRNIDSWNLVD